MVFVLTAVHSRLTQNETVHDHKHIAAEWHNVVTARGAWAGALCEATSTSPMPASVIRLWATIRDILFPVSRQYGKLAAA
jgi:hypothetical protein